MKRILLIAGLLASLTLFAQQMAKPSAVEISTLPQWAQVMYSDDPNVFTVDSLYNDWYRSHAFVKTSHTAYYRLWKHANMPWVNEAGFIRKLAPDYSQQKNSVRGNANRSASTWNMVGAEKVFSANGDRIGEQTNVYCLTECAAHPNVLYCGTEPGEIYKSMDAGLNWTLVSLNEPLGGSVAAICVSPTDSNLVYAGSGDFLFKSADGGLTWNSVLSASSLNVNEIIVHPNDPNVVMVAANKGFFKSTDGGQNWTTVYTQTCWDIKLRPGTADIVYLLKTNTSLLKCEFFISTDTGTSFTIQNNGWYNSTNASRYDGGARLAVSPDDPMRVYAYLIGDSKPNDFGYIGLYRSNDGGQTWTLPNGPDGGPYTSSHLNLAYGEPNWTYHQGYYNCAIMADPNDADRVLIGGLNLWRSNNGGSSFTSVAGYIGGPLSIHVDMQDFRVGINGVWVTNDGAIYYSNDFFVNDNQVRADGVHGSEFWGFGTGWNEDVMVGGLYHNGVVAYHENYGANTFLSLGGAEPASGYVNPGMNTHVYSTEIGGAYLPAAIGTPIQYASFGLSPNESYWSAESSEMEFDPRCYGIAWVGNEHKLYKSTDAGASFNLVYAFGTNVNSKITYFEIANSNPDVMYVGQRPATGNQGKIWKSMDGGATWTQLTIPTGNSSRILISVSPTDEDSVWIAYPSGSNGNKVFVSGNGGTSWSNITSTDLNNQEVRSLQCIGATNGGVYLATNITVYYHNNSMSNWQLDNAGLPATLSSLYLRPFYRDGQIKVSSYGRGIWENTLIDQPAYPIAQPSVDKLNYTINCSPDTFHFEDHSILNHNGATWAWSFPGGNPSSSTQRNPNVVYNTAGTYTVTLTVTNAQNQTDAGQLVITVTPYQINANLAESFQSAFPPQGWFMENTAGGGQWALASNAGGYGQSTQSALFDNYNFDAFGGTSDMRIRTDMTQQNTHWLKFDRAYAPYGGQYSDTLEILISTDCGATFTSLYYRGPGQLATAPTNQNSTFVPTASEWATDSIDLSTWMTSTDLMIVFRNHGYFGQALYIDNINLSTMIGFADLISAEGNATLSPNPVVANQPLTLLSNRNENFTVEIFDAGGKLILREQHKAGDAIQVELAPGIYFYRLTSDSMIRNGKLVSQKR
jgi:PKD repeat protein/photosystem II stability/assembly factor-like uncharacterized protein